MKIREVQATLGGSTVHISAQCHSDALSFVLVRNALSGGPIGDGSTLHLTCQAVPGPVDHEALLTITATFPGAYSAVHIVPGDITVEVAPGRTCG